jgi:hypothetical protein
MMADEKIDNREEMSELLRSFDENPYDTSRKTPEDVMRVFYQFNLPLVPVVSRRGTLIGVILKEDIISAMSDIERASSRKIDDFITSVAQKKTFEELVPFISQTDEFTSINIFGEVQGRMTRSELIAAIDPGGRKCSDDEIEASRDKQVMEWMIYLILEYIPRALYAINVEGKTIFFNSHFEDIYRTATDGDDVDHENVEELIADSSLNRCSFGSGRDTTPIFFNSTLKLSYEKVPMHSGGTLCGYLLYFGKSTAPTSTAKIPLTERINLAERQIIVNELRVCGGDLTVTAKSLSVPRAMLAKKIEKYGIVLDKSSGKSSR